MVLLDPLANLCSHLKNCVMVGKLETYFRPISKLILEVLRVLKENGYIEDYKVVAPFRMRGGVVWIKIKPGAIHDIGAIKPRFPCKWREIPKWEKQFLPSYKMGILILTTPKGVMTHREAFKQRIGGRLLVYVY